MVGSGVLTSGECEWWGVIFVAMVQRSLQRTVRSLVTYDGNCKRYVVSGESHTKRPLDVGLTFVVLIKGAQSEYSPP